MNGKRMLLTLALAVFGTAAVASGFDRISLDSPGAQRAVPRPFRAQADRSAAATDLAREEPAAALADAIAAVKHDPVDGDATAVLGSARLLAGDDTGAAAAFRVAAQFGWRNQATQLYWFEASVLAHDYRVAADRADAILRVHAAYSERDALLAQLETDPVGSGYLMQHLQLRPPWLPKYLDVNGDTPQPVFDRRVAIISDLGKKGFTLGCDSVSSFTKVLLQSARRSDAEAVWNGHCRERPVHGLLADGGFEWIDRPEQFPFTWRALRSGDVELDNQSTSGGGSGLVARNSAPGAREILEQSVALAPGTYRFYLDAGGDKAAAGRLFASFGCGGPASFPGDVEGDPTMDGQLITVASCQRQLIGLWLTPGPSPVRLKSARLEKVG